MDAFEIFKTQILEQELSDKNISESSTSLNNVKVKFDSINEVGDVVDYYVSKGMNKIEAYQLVYELLMQYENN